MTRNSVDPNNKPNIAVPNTSVVIPTIVATMQITINPTDNVTAIPIIGKRTNITRAVTNAAMIIAPNTKNAFAKGLVTSFPLTTI